MRSLFLTLCAGLLCSCTKSKPSAPPVDPLLFTPEQILDSSNYWTYRDFTSFCGRTFVLGFVSGNGRLLHLEFEEGIRGPQQECWICRLKRYHGDLGAIEIEPGSGLERKVLGMMDFVTEYDSGHIILRLPELGLARKMLASRNPRLGFHLQLEPDPRMSVLRLVPTKPSPLPEARGAPRNHHPPSPPPFSDGLPAPGPPAVANPVPEEPDDWKRNDGSTMDSEARQFCRAGE